jgi:erythromycin esterase-like protein
MSHPTLADWVANDAVPFSLDSRESTYAAADRLVAALGAGVELLGLGEPLHGGDEFLVLRNRLFERLATAHGFTAIALESSYPKARVVDEYVAGRGPASYDGVRDAGFGHALGKLDANRELVEWVRAYNADPSHPVPLRFYGFDIPTGAAGNAGPRQVLHFALDYLSEVDPAGGARHRWRVDPLLGPDSDWENPEQYADPAKRVGLSPAAAALRVATEDLISELRMRQPELVAATDADRYAEALHSAATARQLLTYHAEYARNAGLGVPLGIRDVLMADNLTHIVARERGRGKVLAFAHNGHLQRGELVAWESWRKALGAEAFGWWPAGAHLDRLLGPRYAVIGTGVGVSEANGVGPPEAGTLESLLTAAPGPGRFVPTRRGRGLPAAEVAGLPTRSGSATNLSYVPFTAQSLADFDGLAVLDSARYNRGGPPPAR